MTETTYHNAWRIVSYKHIVYPPYPDWCATAYRGKQEVTMIYCDGRTRQEAIENVIQEIEQRRA